MKPPKLSKLSVLANITFLKCDILGPIFHSGVKFSKCERFNNAIH